ncbi:MAG: carotenoid oxygenase family protein [Kofleriaceae bacterium]
MVAARKPGESATLPLELWSKDLGREHGFEPLRVEGKLPASLRGTLYRNGPGQFGQFGRPYAHAFEGDGAVTAIRFADGAAQGAARVTQTTGLVAERAAGKMLYGTSVAWPRRVANMFRRRFKNTANTSVMLWQDRLFALMEGGKPTELDPTTLDFVGEQDLGVVTAAFSAHPHRVAAHRTTYNFGLEYGRVTRLHTYALPDEGAARRLATIELAGPPMLHDFIATESHLIFFISPVRISLPRVILQVGDFNDMFQWRPELGTEVVCIEIANPTEVTRFATEAFYQWHFANAFTRGRELVLDYVRYPSFDTFYEIGGYARGKDEAALSAGRYHRATIDLDRKTLRSEQLADQECEFPTVAPADTGREHPLAFAAFDGLGAIGSIDAKGKITAHELPAHQRATEPLYVDGYLMSLCHEHDRAFVAVYDVARIPDGPVAKIWIDHHVPITFHGTFG